MCIIQVKFLPDFKKRQRLLFCLFFISNIRYKKTAALKTTKQPNKNFLYLQEGLFRNGDVVSVYCNHKLFIGRENEQLEGAVLG